MISVAIGYYDVVRWFIVLIGLNLFRGYGLKTYTIVLILVYNFYCVAFLLFGVYYWYHYAFEVLVKYAMLFLLQIKKNYIEYCWGSAHDSRNCWTLLAGFGWNSTLVRNCWTLLVLEQFISNTFALGRTTLISLGFLWCPLYTNIWCYVFCCIWFCWCCLKYMGWRLAARLFHVVVLEA